MDFWRMVVEHNVATMVLLSTKGRTKGIIRLAKKHYLRNFRLIFQLKQNKFLIMGRKECPAWLENTLRRGKK